MTDAIPQTEEAREAEGMGEKPDLGRTPDALREALSGTDSGSDTLAGSLRGGSASGSDDDPDSKAINLALANEGVADKARAEADPQSPSSTGPDAVVNIGVGPGGADEDPAEARRADEADAATG